MSDSPFRPLATDADWSEALAVSDEHPILVFKHSSACSVSGRAQREMETLAAEIDVPIYRVVVQHSRTVSNEIADTLGVRHETPQILLVQEREPAFDTSHFDVTAATVREALAQSVPTP